MFLVPVLTKNYWFITIYFALCPVSPYLNLLVEHLDKRNFQRLLVTCFGLFVVLPTIGWCLNFPQSDRLCGIWNRQLHVSVSGWTIYPFVLFICEKRLLVFIRIYNQHGHMFNISNRIFRAARIPVQFFDQLRHAFRVLECGLSVLVIQTDGIQQQVH